MDACIAHERGAWPEFVERFSRYVYYLIRRTAVRYRAGIDDERIADLHNDVFVALLDDDCRRLRQFEGRNGCSVRSWVRVIAIRMTLNDIERRRIHISLDDRIADSSGFEVVEDGPDPLDHVMARDEATRRARLAELAASLSPRDRLLLEMLLVQKLPAEAAAAALRISRGALYTRKTRLVQRLRRLAREAGLVDEGISP